MKLPDKLFMRSIKAKIGDKTYKLKYDCRVYSKKDAQKIAQDFAELMKETEK